MRAQPANVWISGSGPLVAVIIRIIAPVLILRYPLAGMVVAILADTLDVVVVALMRSGTFGDNYTALDKLLDLYALGYAVSVSLFWNNRLASTTSTILFAYRLIGVLVLVLTGLRWILFVFPNIFELFYLFHLSTLKWFRGVEVDGLRRLATVLTLMTLTKMVHEYVLHVGGFGPLPFLWGAILVTIVCCLPTSLLAIAHAARYHKRLRSGHAGDVTHEAATAKMWGWVTAAIGAGLTVIWIGLAGLNLTVSYGEVFSG